MLIASGAGVRWLPVGRCLIVVLALVLAGLGAARGTWAALWFAGAGIAAAAVAAATWRRAWRDGDRVTVSALMRRSRTVEVRRMAVRLGRSGYGRGSSVTVGIGRDEVDVPIAVFSPSSRAQIVRIARRAGDALDLVYDEEGWTPWLEGRTLDRPSPHRQPTAR